MPELNEVGRLLISLTGDLGRLAEASAREERARIRWELLDKGSDFLVDEVGADSLRGQKWERFVDRIVPEEG